MAIQYLGVDLAPTTVTYCPSFSLCVHSICVLCVLEVSACGLQYTILGPLQQMTADSHEGPDKKNQVPHVDLPVPHC
jgi:hypothetical protein